MFNKKLNITVSDRLLPSTKKTSGESIRGCDTYVPPLSQIYARLASADGLTNSSLLVQPEFQPAMVRQAVFDRDRLVRSAVCCFSRQGELGAVLDRVKMA